MTSKQLIRRGERRDRGLTLKILAVSRKTADTRYSADAAGFWLERKLARQ